MSSPPRLWRPRMGERGPHKGVILKPFQRMAAFRFAGKVVVDARFIDNNAKLQQWVDLWVRPRVREGGSVEVWERDNHVTPAP